MPTSPIDPPRTARVLSGTVQGLAAFVLEVEAERAPKTYLGVTGLSSETRAKEAEIRVRVALENIGEPEAPRGVHVHIAPADTYMVDSLGLDLPTALAACVQKGIVPDDRLRGFLVVGELSLEGALRPVAGVTSLACLARNHGLRGIILPHENAREAAVIAGLEVLGFRHLRDVLDYCKGDWTPDATTMDVADAFDATDLNAPDLSEVAGNEDARRALEIAAAGGHNLLLEGPAGSGRTLLARRLPTILPAMTFAEAIETTKIYSVARILGDTPLVTRRPFRAPHYTISDVGLVGGGAFMRPGEVTLAHNGVLFLDELPEFKKHTLEVLRQPLDEKRVTISRLRTSATFPASVTLVAAMNPCPCGRAIGCACTEDQILRYRARIPATMMERFPLRAKVEAPSRAAIANGPGESSAAVRLRVEDARHLQAKRFGRVVNVSTNAQMPPSLVAEHCAVPAGAAGNRELHTLRIARTIADLAGRETISEADLLEATFFRGL